jgi:hypothetical protein
MGMSSLFLRFILVVIMVILIAWMSFNAAWQETCNIIPKKFHLFPSWLIWLTCLPFVNIIILWMLIPFGFPKALKKYQPDNKELQAQANNLFQLGISYAISSTVAFLLQCIVPFATIWGIELFASDANTNILLTISALASIINLVLWIMYWIGVVKIRALLPKIEKMATTVQNETALKKYHQIEKNFLTLCYLAIGLLVLTTCSVIIWKALHPPKLVIAIGEPYSQMIKNSTPNLISGDPNEYPNFSTVTQPVPVYFNDAQYGFVISTHISDILINYSNLNSDANKAFVSSISIHIPAKNSPSYLSLNDALALMVNLQNQWQKSGWILAKSPTHQRIYANTLEVRALIKEENFPAEIWNGGKKYQINAEINQEGDNIEKNRYWITLDIGAQDQ